MTGNGPTLAELRAMGPRALGRLLEAGHDIEPTALDDTAYRGVSLGIPHWVERLAWTTFMKTFRRDPETGHLRGWNVRLEQTGLDGPVVPRLRRDGRPKTFGHFRVVPRPERTGLLIHYGLANPGPLAAMGRLRDPIVALAPSCADRLLGYSYLDLGFSLPTPSYFLLERLGPLDHDA